MSKRTPRAPSPDNSPLLLETADPERGRVRGAFLDDAKAWDATPPPATGRRGQGSRAFRTVMLVLIAILALLLLGVRCCSIKCYILTASVYLSFYLFKPAGRLIA